jgi:HNH endonuclease
MLHILQGGIENGDKKLLERIAGSKGKSHTWIAPKSAEDGDDAVIYLGAAFFATARIVSSAQPRPDWGPRAYGVRLNSVRLIRPPISIGIIREVIPDLKWAVYPRSVTTPRPATAGKIIRLIKQRRKREGSDIASTSFNVASIDELFARALRDARPFASKKIIMATYRSRSSAVHHYVLARSNGYCEGCGEAAPFLTANNEPYLEPHHTVRLADEGPDHPASVIALCPTCHRRVHYSKDGDNFNKRLLAKLEKLRL